MVRSRLIRGIVRLLRRRSAAPAAVAAGADHEPARRARIHRHLAADAACNKADAALDRHDLPTARRWIERARAQSPDMPRVRELRARLSLAAGRPLQAVHLLEVDATLNSRRRMLLLLAKCQAGQRAMAHLELRAWSREKSCPAAARAMLAWIELEAGDTDAARRALATSLSLSCDPLTCQIMLLIDLVEQLPQSTRKAAAYLAHAFSHDPFVARWIASFQLTPLLDRAAPPLELIEQLAHQLMQRPHLITSLVVAQQHQPRPSRIELLRRALVRIVDRIDHPIAAVEALARLAQLAGDADDARRWAHRGLQLDPYSAAMTLLIDELADAHHDAAEADIELDVHMMIPSAAEDDTDKPRPIQALRRAVAAWPEYGDLRRAMILRYHKLGLDAQAAHHADRWLAEQPDHPLAIRTRGELAA